MSFFVPVGISNRHLHLSAEDLARLFGEQYALTPIKDLTQKGQFAAKETVSLRTSKGELPNVRVLGPTRPQTQIEISMTDGFKLGIQAPIRESGQIEGSPGITMTGPLGSIVIEQGVIIASRHIHIDEADAKKHKVTNGQVVAVSTDGPRGMIFKNVVVRVRHDFVTDFHIDTDEANAAGLKNGDKVKVITAAINLP